MTHAPAPGSAGVTTCSRPQKNISYFPPLRRVIYVVLLCETPMTLFHSLKQVATKLGLLQIATVEDIAQPTRITTRCISLAELTTQLRAADVNALAAAPSEFTVPFDHIFTAAGIQPI